LYTNSPKRKGEKCARIFLFCPGYDLNEDVLGQLHIGKIEFPGGYLDTRSCLGQADKPYPDLAGFGA